MSGEVEMDKDLMKLVSKAVRPPKKGWETFIANKVALALYSEPLQEIRHIAECVFALERSERRRIGINDDEVKEMIKIHALALTFINKYIEQIDVGTTRKYAALGWPFSPDKMKKWIEPWIEDEDTGDIITRYFPDLVRVASNDLYDRSYALSPASAYAIETRFLKWAIPKTMRVLRKLLRIVSPSTLQEAIAVHRGGGVKREASKL